MVARRERERVLTGRGNVDRVATRAEVDLQRPADRTFVVDDEDARVGRVAHDAEGSASTIVVPPPGVSSTVSSPSISSTNPFATARPRPVPSPALWSPSRWNGSNTFA